MKYIDRYIEEIIKFKLNIFGAVVVTGPKFCGKTTTCEKFAKSKICLNNSSIIESTTLFPSTALDGESPHLIDEWQTVPDIWNYVKSDIDMYYKPGKYILTGSSTPANKEKIYHTGAGRIVSVNMRGLSLSESGESSKCVSISCLFDKKVLDLTKVSNTKTIDDVLFYMCRGGWPLSVLQENKINALEFTKGYCDNLFNFENNKNGKFRNKKNEIFKTLLKSCARNISTPVKVTTIIKDVIQKQDRKTFDRKTFDDYFEALSDLYIINSIDSWNPNLRSKTNFITSPTLHFVDTSIACYALGATPENLKSDLKTTGLLFEDFVIRDLSIYLSLLGGEIKHFRDNNGLECDAILLLPDGKWAAIEIKLGGVDLEEQGVYNLKKFVNNIVTKSNITNPSFCMVVTAFGQPRIAKDGTYIVPITCLTK